MSPRTLGLTAGAVVTLGGLVYLFMQVEADPGPASAESASPPRVAPHPVRSDRPETVAVQPPVKPVDARAQLPVPHMDRFGGAATPTAVDTPGPAASPNPDVDLDQMMDEANKSYDTGDYESAFKMAVAALKTAPDNVRLLRVAVSSACLMGDADSAKKYFASLTGYKDQQDMSIRCGRYDIALEPTAKIRRRDMGGGP